MAIPSFDPSAGSIPNPHSEPRAFLEFLYWSAVRSALPAAMLSHYLPEPPRGRTLVLGAGKAAGAMAQALDAAWPQDAPMDGLVVTRYGHTPPHTAPQRPRIEIVEAAHPVPDAAGLAAAQRMLALTQGLTADDLVICLISGGASSLLTLPVQWPGGSLSLEEKQRINRDLLACGATIAEMNCVRKHLSGIKGGRLGAACAPARVLTLLISDVPGDDPSVIGSGPTVGDPSTCAEALLILQRHALIPRRLVADLLQKSALETPKPGDPVFAGQTVHMLATPLQSLHAAAKVARSAGLAVHVLGAEMEGESRDVGKVHAALARSVAQHGEPFTKPCVILSGGETTVTLRPQAPGTPRGRGGRAGEFCLGLALALQGQPGVYALAADTDGIDGIEDNAGASVQPDTLQRARDLGLQLPDYLDRNDAYGFFEPLGDLFFTGPTHTNVNDFRAILVI